MCTVCMYNAKIQCVKYVCTYIQCAIYSMYSVQYSACNKVCPHLLHTHTGGPLKDTLGPANLWTVERLSTLKR